MLSDMYTNGNPKLLRDYKAFISELISGVILKSSNVTKTAVSLHAQCNYRTFQALQYDWYILGRRQPKASQGNWMSKHYQ